MSERKRVRRNLSAPVDRAAEQISIVKTVLRKWGLVTACFGLLLAVSGCLTLMKYWKPVYEARQFVRVIQDLELLQVLPDEQKGKIDPASQLAPVKSELLLREILLDPAVSQATTAGSYQMRIEELQEKIRFAPAGGELYSIICKDSDPEHAALIAEKVTEVFIDKFFVDYRAERIKELTDSLEKEIVKTTEKVNELNTRLTALKEETSYVVGEQGFLPMDIDGDLLLSLRQDLKEALLMQTQLEMERQLLQQQVDSKQIVLDPAEIKLLVENHADVIRGREYLVKVQNQAAGQYDQVRSVREQAIASVTQYKQYLAQTVARVEQKIRFDLIQASKESAQGKLGDLGLKIMRNDLRIESDNKDIAALSGNRFSVLERQSRYNDLKNEKDKADGLLAKWTDAREKIRSREISPIRVAIAGDPQVMVPTEPVEQYPLKLLAVTVLGSFGIAFVLPLLFELRMRRISEPAQLKLQSELTLIGELASLPRRIQRRFRSRRFIQQVRLYEESVNSVSNAVRFGAQVEGRVIAVCSAVNNEGKTTLASQYAMSKATANMEKTLVIDGDLRCPSMHKVFGMDMQPGLIDVIDETVTLEDAVIATGIDNLDVLLAGDLKCNPMRYFTGERWDELIDRALQSYSFVVVDTPPLLAASEAVAIAKGCDVAILCVMRDVSRQDSVRQAVGRLMAANVNVAGYVFGGVPQKQYVGKYGRYNYSLN